MAECKIEPQVRDVDFDELFAEMQDDMYWIRFFARPCCPAPKLEDAEKMLDRLQGEVRAHGGFSEAQKDALCQAIEGRKKWYEGSGLCRSALR